MSSASTNHLDEGELIVARYVGDPRPELRDLIMVHYKGLAERTARRYSGIESHDDLVQVGLIGLLNALGKFDAAAGVRFNTYATHFVAGEIKHYLRDRTQTIRQPAWLQELRHKVHKTAASLQQKTGKIASERDIADELGVSETSVREVVQAEGLLRVASLDAPTGGDADGDAEVERLDAGDFCPEQLGVEDRLLLQHALSQLRDLERQVLLHFHVDAMNQAEIAQTLGISPNYVAHILRQSLGKLRKILAKEEENDRLLRRQAAALDYEVLDAQTGAYTEEYFRNRLEEEIHRASYEDRGVALVLVDFDGLERLRRFYGESSVLDFLADAAEFFKEAVRRLDIVARYGETGFAIILPETGHNVALVRQRLLEKIDAWMTGHYASNGGITVQIGLSGSPTDGRSAAALLNAAIPRAREGAYAKAA